MEVVRIMLIEFTVKNFLSIKESVTLSMVASKDTAHEESLIEYQDNKKDMRALKSAVIYGANASGKSNVIKAVSFMKQLVKKSHEMQQGKKIKVVPFKLDGKSITESTDFQIIFRYKEVKYAYGFGVKEGNIQEEFLYYYPKGRQTIIFERTDIEEYKFTQDIEVQNQIKDRNSKNKLYLSTAALWNYEKVKAPFEWITENLHVVINDHDFEGFTGDLVNEDMEVNTAIQKFMKTADFGINNISVSLKSINELVKEGFLDDVPTDEKMKLLSRLGDDAELMDISMTHSGLDKEGNVINVQLNLAEESEGTQKFFGLTGVWLDTFKGDNTILIDELDIRLHTLLTRYLIELFHKCEVNKNNAQLIFSTHDTNLLSLDTFRRDQIWFTQKIEEKNYTDLYSLNDYPVRKDDNVQKGYLQGKYGAIPFIHGEQLWD
jgi:AAA15 family ATPase/GTPase